MIVTGLEQNEIASHQNLNPLGWVIDWNNGFARAQDELRLWTPE